MRSEISDSKMRRICREALRRAIPSGEERRETLLFSNNLVKDLKGELRKAGLEAEVRVEGSIAKDTWLAGEKDIDIFILVPKAEGREAFSKVLEVAKKVAGEDYLEAYAEHPYIQANIEGFIVEFVPCFKLKSAKEVVSSVDRTPFHTLYVKRRLNPQTKNEVLLLKRFMRGISAYGAELKVGGFSGYLCEVLVLHYRFFIDLLKASSDWLGGEVIDPEGYYKGREDEVQKIFPEPLIVVDPVDKGRNVASAVRLDRLNEFIAASREFLKSPSLEFFYPEEVKALTVDELTRTMDLKGSTLVFLKTGTVRAVPDVLWGQLYRSQRALTNLVRQHGFTLIRSKVWSDEELSHVFVFELHSDHLPKVETLIGPPLRKRRDCERFLEKHLGSEQVLSGPRVEGDRWVVERRRKYTDIVDLLKDNLKDGGEKTGIASLISQAFLSSIEVWVNHEVVNFYSKTPSFASFLTEYLIGKPRWLH